ncbi:PREDICTED: monocarboxylate transporter 13-like [Branchiostoma belcheri]|uniref:Monocarboxylate transporter 13-like n=1 Tax=Branchiostoma belcheri TaxID=7741 RepID=A0A6P4Y6B1_BRABE|nr:PREDICTED: monocarboxylate transporter 13-like [Branchiostoma belcheri]
MSSMEGNSSTPRAAEGPEEGPPGKRREAPDGGWGWCVVLAGFTVCFCTAGTIRSLGVFFLEFVDQFDSTYGKTSWITSITLAAMYGGGPLASLVDRAVGPRCAVMLGGVTAACGCMCASFATRVVSVYLTLGVMTGFGFSLAFLPTMTMVGRYFDRRRTLANALAWLGACTGNFALPPVFQLLIDRYGWRGALVVISGIALNCCVCGALLRPITSDVTGNDVCRPEKDVVTHRKNAQQTATDSASEKSDYTDTPDAVAYSRIQTETSCGNNVTLYKDKRLSPLQKRSRCKMLGFSLLRKRHFVLYLLSFAFLYFGYYVPFVHLVPRAVYMGVGEYQAAFLVSVLSVGDFVGRVVMGTIPEIPKYGRRLHKYVIASSMLGVCSLLCPLAVTYTAMLVHSVVYGFVNGLIIPLTFAVAADLVGTKRLASAIGLLMMAEGIAASLGPPVAGALYDLTGNYNMSFLTAGSSMFLAGVIMIPVMLSASKEEQPPLDTTELVMDTREKDDERLETVYERLTAV